VKHKDISIVISGAQGQGVTTIERILARTFKSTGYNIFATKEYSREKRSNVNSSQIRVSSERINALVERIDLLVLLNSNVPEHFKKRVTSETVIVCEKGAVDRSYYNANPVFDFPFLNMAEILGSTSFIDIIAAGIVCGIFQCSMEIILQQVKMIFTGKEDVLSRNLKAINTGYFLGISLDIKNRYFQMETDPSIKSEYLLNGTEAVAIGAIAGGCNFVSAYPMSPSAGLFIFLCQQAEGFGIVTEQAEDEVSAINMAIGAWYAGARAMVNTSVGNHSLIGDGMNSRLPDRPIVIHLGQQPGDLKGFNAGLEQRDIEHSFYSGYEKYPKIIFAPGNLEEAFYVAQRSFYLTEKYKVPVVILTDQYLLDSYYNVPQLTLPAGTRNRSYYKTRRNNRNKNSDGKECGAETVDNQNFKINFGDEHLEKIRKIESSAIPPRLIGSKEYETLILGWGSTLNVVSEVMSDLKRNDIAFLHFKQVFPLYKGTVDYLLRAKRIIVIENSAIAQFARLIKVYTGIDIDDSILKYNGIPFSVEEVKHQVLQIIINNESLTRR
jgi:2-oxoglutarate ferredoxin oxidoreductase subunit alpha